MTLFFNIIFFVCIRGVRVTCKYFSRNTLTVQKVFKNTFIIPHFQCMPFSITRYNISHVNGGLKTGSFNIHNGNFKPKYMKFLENLLNRVFKHWQSSLFGLSYGVVFILIYTKHINVAEAISLLTGILAFKNIFLNKDPDKTVTKPEVKENKIDLTTPE